MPEQIIQFFIQHWLETISIAVSGGMLAWVKSIAKEATEKQKREQAKQEAIEDAVIIILHDMLFQICEEYIELGYIPLDKVEKVKNREKKIYKAYSEGLHANSTGTDMHNAFNALPFKSDEEEGE